MSEQNIMNKPIVLQLNAAWAPTELKTIRDAITAMQSDGKCPPALALDIDYEKNEDGEYDFSTPTYMNAVGWDEWIALPVRSFDFVIRSARFTMRAPTVLVAPSFHKMPMKKARPSKGNIFERDGGIDQYTGEYVSRSKGNIDHVIPKSKGGDKNTWENQVWTSTKTNSKKGNQSNKEAGLNLIRKPVAPKEMPASARFTKALHPTHIPFILARQK